MRRIGVVTGGLVIAIAVMAMSMASATVARRAGRQCGIVGVRAHSGSPLVRVRVVVLRGGVSCARARRLPWVVTGFGVTQPGWGCSEQSRPEGEICRGHGSVVRGYYLPNPRPIKVLAPPRFLVRPAVIRPTGDNTAIVGGPDGTDITDLGHLQWEAYNESEGRAVGLIWLNDCVPDCGHGSFSPSRVGVHVFAPLNGHYRRLDLTFRYRGRRYVDRRETHYNRGVNGSRGYWLYNICDARYTPRCTPY